MKQSYVDSETKILNTAMKTATLTAIVVPLAIITITVIRIPIVGMDMIHGITILGFTPVIITIHGEDLIDLIVAGERDTTPIMVGMEDIHGEIPVVIIIITTGLIGVITIQDIPTDLIEIHTVDMVTMAIPTIITVVETISNTHRIICLLGIITTKVHNGLPKLQIALANV
jgi:hypothetical protein